MELTSMEMEDSEGMHLYRMESIRGFLIYVARKYRDMNPYLKGLFLLCIVGYRTETKMDGNYKGKS